MLDDLHGLLAHGLLKWFWTVSGQQSSGLWRFRRTSLVDLCREGCIVVIKVAQSL